MVISSKKLMIAMAGREMRAADVADEAGLTRQTLSAIILYGKCKLCNTRENPILWA